MLLTIFSKWVQTTWLAHFEPFFLLLCCSLSFPAHSISIFLLWFNFSSFYSFLSHSFILSLSFLIISTSLPILPHVPHLPPFSSPIFHSSLKLISPLFLSNVSFCFLPNTMSFLFDQNMKNSNFESEPIGLCLLGLFWWGGGGGANWGGIFEKMPPINEGSLKPFC